MKWSSNYVACICAGFLAVSIQHADAQCSMTNPCADELGAGAKFAETVQSSSTSSSWSIDMNVAIATVTYNWLELKRRAYNGRILGPTWTVKQGDTVTVNLNNQLSDTGNDPGTPTKENGPKYPNTTNLHTHGLHISAEDPQDNVLKHINPGELYRYVYQIHAEQPAGTYWYHAHFHGSTQFQVIGGLAGMLIVQDDVNAMPDELAAVSCPDNCDKDIQLLFQPILIFNGRRAYGAAQDAISDYDGFQHDSYNVTGGGTLTDWLSKNVNHFTTNGQLQPQLAMVTGQMYRFRMVNAGGDHSLELYIVGDNDVATANCEIREIAIDGVYLDAPRKMHDSQTFLVPGSKADWMVKCNVAGTYKIRSFADKKHQPSIGQFNRFIGDMVTLEIRSFDDKKHQPSIGQFNRFIGDMLTLEVTGDPVQNFPASLPDRPSFITDLRNVKQSEIGGRFVVESGGPFGLRRLNRGYFSSGTNYRYKMKVGTIQEWHLVNTNTETSHPIHIHVNHFQVISFNNYTGGFGSGEGENSTLFDVTNRQTCFYQREGFTAGGVDNGDDDLGYLGHDTRFEMDAGNTLGYPRLGDWREVLLVPPLSNITIRFNAHEHTGDVIIHCHILIHEDAGMMMITQIVGTGESTEANVPSGNAYPGTCRECDRYPFNNSTRLCDEAATAVDGLF